jgi:hypothetical protein
MISCDCTSRKLAESNTKFPLNIHKPIFPTPVNHTVFTSRNVEMDKMACNDYYPFLSLRLFKAWVRVPDFVARRWACSVQVWLHARSVYIRTSVAHAMIRSRGFSRPCCEGVILTIIIRLAILEVAWLCSVGMLRFICVFRAILPLIPAGDTFKRGHISLLKGRRTLRVFV